MDEEEVKYAALRAAKVEQWHRARTQSRLARELDILDIEAQRICDWIYQPLKVRWDRITGDQVRTWLEDNDLTAVAAAEMMSMQPETLRRWMHNKHLANFINTEKMRQLMNTYNKPKKDEE